MCAFGVSMWLLCSVGSCTILSNADSLVWDTFVRSVVSESLNQNDSVPKTKSNGKPEEKPRKNILRAGALVYTRKAANQGCCEALESKNIFKSVPLVE